MKHASVVLFALCAAVACAPTTPANPGAFQTPTIAAKTGTIRISLATLDTGDIPTLMAVDLLKAEGYTVETIQFANTELQAAALAAGTIDFGRGSTITHWTARSKGAKITTIMEQLANDWALVARPEIKQCADLQGRRMAVTSPSAQNAALAKAYIQQNCPGTTTDTIFISASETRAAALVAGELDATLLKLGDALLLQRKSPGRFNTLANFAEKLRSLKASGVYVNTDFAQQYPERVQDTIRAFLTAHRQVRDDPTVLTRLLMEQLKFDEETARAIGGAYLDQKIWDVNGNLTAQDIQSTIDFFVGTGSLPAGLKPQDVADLSYLEAVLSEIGRK